MEIKRQQDKMKNMKSIWALCLCLLGISAFFSCTRELFDVENGIATPAGKFVLNVSTGSKTRVALGEDGMTMYWQPGDQLVMVNMETRDSIHLKTDITEPATEARFVSEVGVGTGNYYVLCNINSKTLSFSSKESRKLELEEDGNLFKNAESRQYKLYSTLHVNDGDTQATIEMKHVYAKVKLELLNYSSYFTPLQIKNVPVIMAAAGAPFPTANTLSIDPAVVEKSDLSTISQMSEVELRNYLEMKNSQKDFEPQDYKFTQTVKLGSIEQNPSDIVTLMLPVDLCNQNVYFYLSRNANSKFEIFEFVKPGINLKAGGSYKITLDFNDVEPMRFSSVTVNSKTCYEVGTAKELRAIAACTYGSYVTFSDDIDCTNEDMYPLSSNIYGRNHVLKGINIFSEGDNIALSRYSYVQDLNLVDCSFKGRDNVAGLLSRKSNPSYPCEVSNNNLTNCKIEGRNNVGGICDLGRDIIKKNKLKGCSIKGEDYVGGICSTFKAYSNNEFSQNVLIESCDIEGNNYVGGLVGSVQESGLTINSCSSSAIINALGNYIGGIVGYDSGTIFRNCSNLASVKGATHVGGLVGYDNNFNFLRCYNSGNVQGTGYVGGILGDSSTQGLITACYNAGNITSGDIAGGLLGALPSTAINTVAIKDSYSIGRTEGGNISGGLIGDLGEGRRNDVKHSATIQNSYVSSPIFTVTEGEENPYASDSRYTLWKTIIPEEITDTPPVYLYVENSIAYIGRMGNYTSADITNSLTSMPIPMCQVGTTGSTISIDEVSKTPVTSIYNNLSVINGESAYSTATKYLWDTDVYMALCPIHVWAADPIWGNVHMPAFGAETDWDSVGNSGTNP